jgi:hypothetical protein
MFVRPMFCVPCTHDTQDQESSTPSGVQSGRSTKNRKNKHPITQILTIMWRVYSIGPLLNTKCDVLGYWRHRSGLLLPLFTTSLVVTTITFYNVRSSLPCWFFILVGPLIAGFLVAALICPFHLLLTLRLWSVPLICSDLLLLSALLICVSGRFLWSAPDVASPIGSFDHSDVFCRNLPC